MTGVVSAMADDLVLGEFALAGVGLASFLAFLAGAMATSLMINWARRRRLRSLFALPLFLEAALLLCFGLLGTSLGSHTALLVPATLLLPGTVLLLCFLMGLQNAVITKVSRAEIRTTHVTGLTTDLGIELGKLFFVNRDSELGPVMANRAKLRIHLLLIGCFFGGGIVGAFGFKHLGFIATVPLAVLLALIAARPLAEDAQVRWRLLRRQGPE
jgi:uncharacterized membrane protein YoaK (UPF0700 family)